jgi:hypothetical protein
MVRRRREIMRGHIKIFTLQIDVERAYRFNAARTAVIGSLDKSSILSMDLAVHSPQELISGK